MTSLRIAVVTPLPVSGAEGGNERHWRSLTAALNDAGHEAELVGLVSPEANLPEILASYRMFHDLDLSWADVVVSGKYPSFMVRHPRHVRHLNHTLRGLYEHYPAHLSRDVPSELVKELDQLGDDVDAVIDWAERYCESAGSDPLFAFPGPFARLVVQRLDSIGRDRLAAEATVSEVVAARPGYVDPTRAITVVPPLGDLDIDADPAHSSTTDEPPFLFAFGRLDGAKRFDLIMRSFDRARRLPGMTGVELVIAGDGPMADELRELAPPGARFTGRLPDDQLRDHLRRARAVVLTPIDEDYGLVAAEAMAAATPVITTTDSGGIAEQITHGVNGLIVPPRTPVLAVAMRRLATDGAASARMGRAAIDAVAGVSWKPMIDLIEATADPRNEPRVLLVSTFGADPVSNGGERRLRGMAQGLAADGWQTTVLSLSASVAPDTIRRRRTHDGVCHVAVGRSRAHLAADFAMSTLVGVPVDDIAAAELWPSTPSFQPELEAQLTHADVVVASHPFLLPAILATGIPAHLVYDAFNVETDLKAELLAGRDGAEWFGRRATSTEAMALEHANVVSATSTHDLDRLRVLADRPITGVVAQNPLDASVASLRSAPEQASARHRFLQDLSRQGDTRPIVVFIGSDHPPNRAAAARAAELAELRPDLHVVVAGTVSVPGSGALSAIGPFHSSDLRRLQVMADVVINPVTEGSGTSLKLIDPLALGVPVVSTRVGARGIGNPDDALWLTEPDAAAIGDAIDQVLVDAAERARRIQNGRVIAEQATPSAAMADLAQAMHELLS